MRFHRLICGVATLAALWGATCSIAQELIYHTDFESGIDDVETIRRYADTPTAETQAPSGMEAAFPPPSGRTVLVLTPAHDNSNLAATIMGPVVDRRDTSRGPVTIEARLYLEPSNQFDESNAALIAIDDSGALTTAERYHRFGFRSGSVYHQMFDGANFVDTVNDAALASAITTPGWHTFAMRFEGTDVIRFFVDGREANFSPVRDATITRVRGGALLLSSSLPLLVDDFQVTRATSRPFLDEIILTTDVESPGQGAFYLIDGNWRSSPQMSRAPGIEGNHTSWRLMSGASGSAAFAPLIPDEEMCEVFATWTREANSSNVQWTVNTAGGSRRTTLDQDGHGGRDRMNADGWVSLGVHRFVPGTSPTIIVSSTPQSRAISTSDPQVISAAAVRIVPQSLQRAIETNAIRWRRSFAEALNESAATQRNLIIFAYSERSSGSQVVMDTVLTDPQVVEAFNAGVPVSVRLDDVPSFAIDFAIGRVPAVVVLHPDGTEIARHMGRISIADLLDLLGQP